VSGWVGLREWASPTINTPTDQTNATTSTTTHPPTHTHTQTYSYTPTTTTITTTTGAAFRAAGELGGKIVAENAKAGTLCGMALDIFAGAYGAEAGVAGASRVVLCCVVLCCVGGVWGACGRVLGGRHGSIVKETAHDPLTD
jgi:hypothetical protein